MLRFIISRMLFEKVFNMCFFERFYVVRIDELEDIKNSNAYDKAFSLLIMPNSTSKQTEMNRFKELNDFLLPYLNEFKNIIKCHDIAVSNGITSLELLELLEKNKIRIDLTISDKFSKIYLVKNKLYDIILDENNNIVGIYFMKLYLSDSISWKYFISRFLFIFFKKINFLDLKKEKKEYLLLNKKLLSLINEKKVTYLDYDILVFANITEEFNFIRAMNILNLCYFTKDEIAQSLSNIYISLEENGFFLVGKTINHKSHASLFQKKNGIFNLIVDINDGSEIKDIIKKFNIYN